jgi:hypothetical protein
MFCAIGGTVGIVDTEGTGVLNAPWVKFRMFRAISGTVGIVDTEGTGGSEGSVG